MRWYLEPLAGGETQVVRLIPKMTYISGSYSIGGTIYYQNRYVLTLSDKTCHEFVNKDNGGDVNESVYLTLERFRSRDSSHMQFRETTHRTAGTLYLKAGTRIYFSSPDGTITLLATFAHDTNSNIEEIRKYAYGAGADPHYLVSVGNCLGPSRRPKAKPSPSRFQSASSGRQTNAVARTENLNDPLLIGKPIPSSVSKELRGACGQGQPFKTHSSPRLGWAVAKGPRNRTCQRRVRQNSITGLVRHVIGDSHRSW